MTLIPPFDGDLPRIMFLQKISKKLNEKNFLILCQQIKPIIDAHNFQDFIYFPIIPSHFVKNPNSIVPEENRDHLIWLCKNQWFLSWLQSTLYGLFMSHVIRWTKSLNYESEFTLILKN